MDYMRPYTQYIQVAKRRLFCRPLSNVSLETFAEWKVRR